MNKPKCEVYKMKKAELIKQTQSEFDEMLLDKSIETLKIWNCKIKDYSKLNTLTNLRELEIFSFETGTLNNLKELKNLEKLRIIHLPQIHSLEELTNLENLTELSLESLPNWDSSGKTLIFDNLNSLSSLTNLKKLVLMKARVLNHGLSPLEKLNNLEVFETDNTFSVRDFAKLSLKLPKVKCAYFKAYRSVNYSKCKKCDSYKVKLTGIENNKMLCPICNIDKLKKYEIEFENLKNES